MIATPSPRAWSNDEQDLECLPEPLDRRMGESDEHHADRVDTALMARFRDGGDRRVFDALYRHSRVRVFAWLRWVLREQQVRLDPVELLQDTFVNVYRYASSFRSEHESSFRSWVRTIAANVVRRARSTGAFKVTNDVQASWSEPVDARPGPQRRVSDGEEHLQLRAAWILFLEHYASAYDRSSWSSSPATRTPKPARCSASVRRT
jgi:DNA-directed RNA polymerase specialized sigma24 family protein